MRSRILIADDMRENIIILMHALRDNYSVIAARSGEAAIDLLQSNPPDLVLMDVNMPGINGFDVLMRMQRDEKLSGIPLIFVTAEYDAAGEERALRLGAVDYIRKPFNISIVHAKVYNHLKIKKYQDKLEALLKKRESQLAASREALRLVYDALLYKKTLTHEEALAVIFNRGDGTLPAQLDPLVLDMFREIDPVFEMLVPMPEL
jgi:putative two-component system response regulator